MSLPHLYNGRFSSMGYRGGSRGGRGGGSLGGRGRPRDINSNLILGASYLTNSLGTENALQSNYNQSAYLDDDDDEEDEEEESPPRSV